ncbi:hypothetical protein CTRI78_v009725 [Colletotrichum trifolii]|uniref:Uncharacterized protein n=1 Tax=Colletotrichum trifolii TaxID=5466 RepID=A0A4R8QRS7_COLTR|nr:hypothetical protein CTRI78_v009725 [Colletotrichum trifolii]
MAGSTHGRIPSSLQAVAEAEEVRLLSSPASDDQERPPTTGGLLSSPSLFQRDGYAPVARGTIGLSPLDSNGQYQDTALAGTLTLGTPDRDSFGISGGSATKRVSVSRVPVGSKRASPATPRSSHGLVSSPVCGTTSPRSVVIESGSPPQRLISPLQSPLTFPNTAKEAARKRDGQMPWDDPPLDPDPWHAAPADDNGDLGQATPTKTNDIRHSTRSLTSDEADGPPMRRDHVHKEHDHIDDEATFYKRFSQPPSYCDSRKDVHKRRANWLSISIIALSIYSTGLSCLWFVVAVVQPRWGPTISSSGGMAPSTATMVCAMFAKTIEISFVTVFVAFIGQVLSRRSFVRRSRGMTLAEMTMRNWVIQPGFMITHWETLPYAAVTFLGVISLVATIASTFYTTASDVMVSPKLKFGGWESREMKGFVLSSYGNIFATRASCQTPLRKEDPNGEDAAAIACLELQYAGQSYRNLVSFLSVWDEINHNGTSSAVDMAQRPVGTTLLHDNTTLTSAWIETESGNTTEYFEREGRIIHNVTLAMPHPGVYAAATHPVNKILQPDDLSGVGEYAIKASVVSPVINVLCVNAAEDDLAPLIYTKWNGSTVERTGVGEQVTGHSEWAGEVPPAADDEWLNRTVLDDIFHWGEKYERRPPVFQLYPADFNMITNSSVGPHVPPQAYMGIVGILADEKQVYGSDAMYILTKAHDLTDYTMCELRSWVTPHCSTHFNISGTTGSHMQAHCESVDDPNSYISSVPDVTPDEAVKDWRDIADQWRLSMDINGGTVNNNASNARSITQFVLKEGRLNPLLPSISEALAVFASSTLVIGSLGSPFIHYWDYRAKMNMLGEPGALATFNATIRRQEYTSSHEYEWQGVFYVVLALVLVVNVFCLAYFVSRSGLVTDYTEPQNLFTLAVNSPPSEQLKGSCGGGPAKRDFVVPWRVAYAKGPNHYFIEEASERPWRGRYARQDAPRDADDDDDDDDEQDEQDEHRRARERSSYKRLSTSRAWL